VISGRDEDLVRLAGRGWFRSWRTGLGFVRTGKGEEDRSREERSNGGLLVLLLGEAGFEFVKWKS